MVMNGRGGSRARLMETKWSTGALAREICHLWIALTIILALATALWVALAPHLAWVQPYLDAHDR